MSKTQQHQNIWLPTVLVLTIVVALGLFVMPVSAAEQNEGGGGVTIVASIYGEDVYCRAAECGYLGEEVKLSGTNFASEKTYLFITGGQHLPRYGGQLRSPRTPTVIGQETTFDVATVQADNTWEYKWLTAGIELDADGYMIYAVSAPINGNSRDTINAPHDSVTLSILKPYVHATLSTSVVAQGDKLYISGIAEGDPSDGVAVWIIGENYVAYSTATVNDDKTFEYEVMEGVTSAMGGQYFVIVQHSMYNDQFDVYPDSTTSPQYVLGEDPVPQSTLFRIEGSDASDALTNAIRTMGDDHYAKMQFFVEEAKVSINPIVAEAAPGEVVTSVAEVMPEEIFVDDVIEETVVAEGQTEASPGFGALFALAGLGAVAFTVGCKN